VGGRRSREAQLAGSAPTALRSRRAIGRGSGCATAGPACGSRPWRCAMPEAEQPIEAALERLEAIADQLEDPQLDLDVAVKLYEEGLRLYAECTKRLDAADQKITKLADALAQQASRAARPPA